MTFSKNIIKKKNLPKIGERFGRLEVIKKLGKHPKYGWTNYKCQCSCGKFIEVRGSSLRAGRSKSCGCYKFDRIKEATRLPPGESSFRALERSCKRSASSRNLEYTLTQQQFRKIITQNCHYCGAVGRDYNCYQTQERYTDDWKSQQWLIINGIDRKDNNKGYTLENSVPCCEICNEGKNNKSYDKYIEYLNNLVEYRTKAVDKN
jgi:hypothetical protein